MTTAETRPLMRLTRLYVDLFPQEAAEKLEGTPPSEINELLRELSPGRAAALVQALSPDLGASCLEAMSPEDCATILGSVDAARTALLLTRLDAAAAEQRLAALRSALAEEVRSIMSYPEGTAGALMDRLVTSFPATLTAREVLSKLHTLRRRRVQTIFVIDAEGRLAGALPLHEVILALTDQRLGELVHAAPVSVRATAPRDDVLEALTDYQLSSLPVVDFHGRLVGTIRRDAMIKAVQEAATAGIQTMVGASREERALSGPLFAVRKRLPWLNVNLLTAFLAAAVVGLFEGTIARFTALAVLLPVVAGQSGNTGAQALAVTMRGLALREVRARQWSRVVVKEAAAGLVNGVAIALVTMVGVYVWSGSPGLCLVIGVAMVSSMVVAGVSGTAIPIVLTSIGQDPAQSSSIVLTTVTDVIGFLSFLGLATLLADLLVA